MKVILLKDVSKLGKKYDIKEVSSGHAQNLLIPRGLALAGTADALKKVEAQKAKEAGERKIQEELLAQNIKQLEQVTLKIVGKANAKGHLFAGIHREEIATELAKQSRVQVDASFIQLDQPIKEVGEHMIEVKAGGKSATFKIQVTSN